MSDLSPAISKTRSLKFEPTRTSNLASENLIRGGCSASAKNQDGGRVVICVFDYSDSHNCHLKAFISYAMWHCVMIRKFSSRSKLAYHLCSRCISMLPRSTSRHVLHRLYSRDQQSSSTSLVNRVLRCGLTARKQPLSSYTGRAVLLFGFIHSSYVIQHREAKKRLER